MWKGLVIGVVILGAWWFWKKKKPAAEEDLPPPPADDESNADLPSRDAEDPPSDSTPGDGGREKIGDIAGKIGDWFRENPPPDLPEYDLAPIVDLPVDPEPGSSPGNPLPSSELYPGFTGFFQVESGDTLTKLANRLGIGGTNWRQLRDDPVNDWAVQVCPNKWKKPPYVPNGSDNIALVPNYGKTPPGDCSYPGFEATYYGGYTGQLPVLHWGGGPL